MLRLCVKFVLSGPPFPHYVSMVRIFHILECTLSMGHRLAAPPTGSRLVPLRKVCSSEVTFDL